MNALKLVPPISSISPDEPSTKPTTLNRSSGLDSESDLSSKSKSDSQPESIFTLDSLRTQVLRLPPQLQSLLVNAIIGFSVSPAGQMLGLLLDLNRRLEGPHPLRQSGQVVIQRRMSAEELDAVSYDELIDEEGKGKDTLLGGLEKSAIKATGRGYVVVGGSGFVGRLVQRSPSSLSFQILFRRTAKAHFGSREV